MSCINGIIINDTTDHFSIFHIYQDAVTKKDKKLIFNRNFIHKAQLSFNFLSQDVDWNCI